MLTPDELAAVERRKREILLSRSLCRLAGQDPDGTDPWGVPNTWEHARRAQEALDLTEAQPDAAS